MNKGNAFSLTRIALIFFCLSTAAVYAELITKSPYSDSMSKKIIFKNANQGKASCVGPGCHCEVSFSYVVEDDTVRVTQTSQTNKDGNDCPVGLLYNPCKLRTSGEDKIYSNQLVCGDEQYTNTKASIAVNTQTEINSVPVIFLGKARGQATTGVKLRAAPDANSEAGKCHNDGGMIETLPKKAGVAVVARTGDKVKVANWENYWYFVQVDSYECSFEKTPAGLPYQGAWVFGEFIKLKP